MAIIKECKKKYKKKVRNNNNIITTPKDYCADDVLQQPYTNKKKSLCFCIFFFQSEWTFFRIVSNALMLGYFLR